MNFALADERIAGLAKDRARVPAGLALVLALGLVSGFATAVKAQEGGPVKHFTVENPAELTDADARRIYQRLADDLIEGYRLSGRPVAEAYQDWRYFNAAPYRSETHGERFVNNYANGLARGYGEPDQPASLPVGAIAAKDSFTVTAAGGVFSGPLFVMEKMPLGFNPASRDWRYTMIMPDGSVFGETKGPGFRNVAFCVTCHERAGDENDHLYFVPEAYRRSQP